MEKQFSRGAPSPRYVELLGLYKEMHDDGQEQEGIPADQMFAGHSLVPLVRVIKQVVDKFRPRTMLDYGAGKGMVYRGPVNLKERTYNSIAEYWGVDDITCYDPGYEPFSVLPGEKFDGVICTDVLEHIPAEDLPWILEELFSYARVFVFGNIANYPAKKRLPNGENAHCTIQPREWWADLISDIAKDYPDIRYIFTVDSIVSGADGQTTRNTEAIAG
jgi:hypothetical protein